MEVYVNIYDLSTYNRYGEWLGIGAYHTGIEVNNIEYGYGYSTQEEGGVFCCEPGMLEGPSLKTRYLLGKTYKSFLEVQLITEQLSEEFRGADYNLLTKNCNHFSEALAKRLVGKGIPSYCNRGANLMQCFSCLLPFKFLQEPEEQPINFKRSF